MGWLRGLNGRDCGEVVFPSSISMRETVTDEVEIRH